MTGISTDTEELMKECDANLGYRLGFSSLLDVVGGDTLGLDAFCLRILFIVRSKEIDLIVVLRFGGSSTSEEDFTSLARPRQRGMLRGVRLNMCVPSCYMRIRGGIWGGTDSFENVYIRLRRCVSGKQNMVQLRYSNSQDKIDKMTGETIRKPGNNYRHTGAAVSSRFLETRTIAKNSSRTPHGAAHE